MLGNSGAESWSGLAVCDTETEEKENVDLCRMQGLSVKQRGRTITARLTRLMTALMSSLVLDLDAADYGD